MLIQTIRQYLESHKRLVIPQLGAFIVKVPGGEVLFSELFRRDDGVLRTLLREQGMNELEAAGAIDRFAFEVRHALQEGGEYRIEGLGVFFRGENDTILFRHCPAAHAGQEPVSSAAQPEHPERPAPKPASEPRISISPKVQPDPSLKGLRYGRPQKNANPYRYANGNGKRRVDRFLLLAVAAAILAVAAIAYGYFLSSQTDETEEPQTEQLQIPANPAPEVLQTEEIHP